ncbi:MAG: tyrosine-type recombinase/integrase [Candidatus Woesebacteria bacterium]|nr:tyrosine-type recombinase/integrase [Candidatus Woesebacteria bacterium]
MPNNTLSISHHIDEFIDYLDLKKNYSPLTIRNYSHYLKRFLNFLKLEKIDNLTDLDVGLVNKYKESLIKIKLSKKTTGYHLISLRSFLKWMNKNGKNLLNVDQIEIPKAEANKLIFLNGFDVEKLLETPDSNTIQGKRDRAILELFYATGLRISDLTSLDRDSFDNSKNEIRLKKKILFLPTRAIKWIVEYINSRNDKNNALFVSSKGQITRLTPRSVERMLKKYTKKVGLPDNITPKALRHSFATDLLLAGAEIGSIQKMLGHKNISTTQIYTHVTNKQLHDIHETFHGRGK